MSRYKEHEENTLDFQYLVGATLRLMRKCARLSIAEMCDLTGYPAYSILSIESGREIPTSADLQVYGAPFKLSAAAILKRAWKVQEMAYDQKLTIREAA